MKLASPVYQDRAGNKKLEKIRASLNVLSETTPQFLDALHRRAQESMSPLESKPPRTVMRAEDRPCSTAGGRGDRPIPFSARQRMLVTPERRLIQKSF